MDKNNYLEYVRVLHDRLSNEARQNGVTKWALVAAIVYLLLQALPDFAQLQNGNVPIEYFLLTQTRLLGIVIGIGIIYLSLRGQSSIGRFDHRFSRPASARGWLRSGFQLWPTITTFGLLALWAWLRVQNRPEIEHYMFAASACFFLFVSAVPIIVAIGIIFAHSDGDSYPTPTSLRYKQSASSDTFDIILSACAVALLLINAYYLFLRPDSVNPTQFVLAASLALKVALTLIACSSFVSFLSKAEQLRALERLERDIVLHDIDIVEIKRRLEEDYLGREFSNWLQEQVAEIGANTGALTELIDQAPGFLDGLESLDKSLTHERTGRINEYQSKIQKLLDTNQSSQERLRKRLNALLERAKSDKYILTRIEETLKQMDSTTKDALSAARSLQRRLTQLNTA